MKIILRILSFPFVLGLILIAYNTYGFARAVSFLKHGGEWINYRKGDKKTIYDIYLKLETTLIKKDSEFPNL
jgi:hypothetical protein